MLKMYRKGYLPSEYRDSALAALDKVLENITDDGVVTMVSYGTPMGKDFYKEIPYKSMPYGSALAIILYLIEVLEVFR